MRILVTFAVEAEFAPWREVRAFRRVRAKAMDYFTSEMNGSVVDVMLIGIGCKKPWLDLTNEIYDSEIQLCVSTGLAGALRPEHLIGEILVAEKVLAPPLDISAMSDSALIETAVSFGAKKVSSFYTSERVMAGAAEKREMADFADAVDMESFDVLIEGGMFAEKIVAIRAISDTAKEDLPLDFNKVMTSTGEVSFPRVLGELVRHPLSAPALMRFGKQSRMAAEKLAAFLDRYVEAVASSRNRIPGVAAQ